MSTRETEDTRRAWDKVAPGSAPPRTSAWGSKHCAGRASSQICGYWMWPPAAVP
jgi:hypothetical protein